MEGQSKDKVCAEFCAKFPTGRPGISAQERVRWILKHPKIRSKLDEWIGTKNIGKEDPISSKNAKTSASKKEMGNAYFKAKKLHESLKAYNDAIRFAPVISQNGSECELFPLSLANRSAVYYELGEAFYDKSIIDIDLAIKHGYPDRLKCKLLLRKANIYARKKMWARAKSVVDEIQRLLNQHPNNHELHPDGVAKLRDLTERISVHEADESEEIASVPSPTNCLNFEGESNADFVNGSVNLELVFSPSKTRHVIARKNLKKRDALFYEMPFASVLLPQYYETHCHDCHRVLEHSYFIPCRRCVEVRFCSESCSDRAWDVYHQHECQSLELLHSIGIAHLAVRIILCAGLPVILETLEKDAVLCDPSKLEVFACNFSEYERVYSLLDHLEDMCVEDVFQYSLTAGLLTNWLDKRTSFFRGNSDSCPGIATNSEAIIDAGGVILHHICQLICNAHAITDILSDVNSENSAHCTAEESQSRIATAIFPSASMMNHSCDPNITFTFKEGKRLFVKLTTDVLQGDEIFNCYGPHYRRMGLTSRQENLRSQYLFDCKCHVCVDEINKGHSFVDIFDAYRCKECDGPVIPSNSNDLSGVCRKCGAICDLKIQLASQNYADGIFEQGLLHLEGGNLKQALSTFRQSEVQFLQNLYCHSSKIGRLYDTMARCYAEYGDLDKAAEYLSKSLAYVEKRFGDESVEYAREVKKYVEVLKCGGQQHAAEIERLTELYESLILS